MAGSNIIVDISMIREGSKALNDYKAKMADQIAQCQRLADDVEWNGDAADAFRALWTSTKAQLELVRDALGETGSSLDTVASTYRSAEDARKQRIQGITLPALGNFGQKDAFE
jgi:uncharacterized protein YukE